MLCNRIYVLLDFIVGRLVVFFVSRNVQIEMRVRTFELRKNILEVVSNIHGREILVRSGIKMGGACAHPPLVVKPPPLVQISIMYLYYKCYKS